MSSFTEPLVVKHLDGSRWELMEKFIYFIGAEDSDEFVRVPKGFITDFASIPRLFWTLIGPPTGRYGKSAVIHDFLYDTQPVTRKKADLIFYEAMQVLKVPFYKRWLMYHAVRTFAWMPWNRHTKELEEEK